MKAIHLSLIGIAVFLLFLNLGQAHADDDRYVQNIKVQPSAVKLGDAFTVTATLVNNSTGPIWVEGGKCSATDKQAEILTVTFDYHAKIKTKSGLFCAGVGWYQKLDPGQRFTTTAPDYTATFIATGSGTANGKIRFSYHIFNLTDPTQPGYDGKISQPFQFAISNQSGSKPETVYGGGGTVARTALDPLKQFKSGIAAKDVKCNNDLQLIIKAEDGSPACVKHDTAQKLIERGWAKGIASSSMDESHNLKLSFSTNSSSIQSGHAIGIGISLNNTSSGSFSIKDQNHWPIDGMRLGSCQNLPIGISILRGHYTLQNMSSASSLRLYPNLPCPHPVGTTGYTFQPMSNVATRECSPPFFCNDSITLEGRLAISGYLTGNGIETSFENGNYTIVGGDEWGDVIIRHFTVVNATSVPMANQTSQIIPSCAFNIPHQSVFAGYAGSLSCPAMQYYMNSKILNYSGFAGVYHTISNSSVVGPSTYTNPLQEQIDKDGNDRMEANLVLEPGYNGTITYQLTLHVGRCAGSCPPGMAFPTVVNQTNIGEFIHRQGNEMLHSHYGLGVTYEPQSESMQDNHAVTLKATVTASKDVPPGTYWLVLTPGNCVGGPLVLITVSDCENK